MDLLLGCFLMICVMVIAVMAVVGTALRSNRPAQAAPGGPRADESLPYLYCPRCQAARVFVQGHCAVCHAPDLSDVHATMRQLRRWRDAELISPDEYDRLLSLASRTLAFEPSTAPPAPESAPRVEAGLPSAPLTVASSTVASSTAASSTATAAPSMASLAPAVPAFAPAPSTSGEPEIVDAVVCEPDGVAQTTPVHPLDRPPEPERPWEPSAPRRALADVLQAFMEERNIRWGEIISGILIVVSAVGLVVSLRATLRETIPYFPALLFLGVTGGIHLAGHYSLRRWNLKSTSRGVLIIGTLLIPLNFLAAILLSGAGESQRPVNDPWFIVALAMGVAAFSFMTWKAARALARSGHWRWMVALILPSVAQVLVHRLAPSTPTLLSSSLLLTLPLLGLFVPSVERLRIGRRRAHATRRFAHQLLLELGLSTYAWAVPLGLLLLKADDRRVSLACAAPALSLLGATLLAHGLLLHRRWTAAHFAALRATGTALAFLGAATLLVSLAAGWPDPNILIALGVLNFVMASVLARGADLAPLHMAAASSLSVAYLVGFHRWRAPLEGSRSEIGRRLIDLTATGPSAMALLVLAALFATIAILAPRPRWATLTRGYLAVAGSLGVVSLLVTLIAGFLRGVDSGSDWATPLLALFTLAAGIVSYTRRHAVATLAGAVLLGLALAHVFVFHVSLGDWVARHFADRWQAACLTHVVLLTLYALSAAIVGWHFARQWSVGRSVPWKPCWPQFETCGRWWPDVVLPAIRVAQVVSLPTLLLICYPIHDDYWSQARDCGLIALAWLVAARLEGRSSWITAAELLSVWITLLVVAALARSQPWWQASRVDLRYWEWSLAGLGLWCVAVAVARRGLSRWGKRFTTPSWPCDAWLAPFLAFAATLLAFLAVLPGARLELTGESTTTMARTLGALLTPDRIDVRELWGIVGLLTVAVRVCVPALGRHTTSIWLWTLSTAVPLLIAAPWATDWASLTMLRWSVGILAVAWIAVLSVPERARGIVLRLLCGRRVDQPPTAWRLEAPGEFSDASIVARLRDATLLLAALVIVGLTTLTVVQLAGGHPPVGPRAASLFARWGPSISYGVPLALLGFCFLVTAMRFRQPWLALLGNLTSTYLAALACLIPILQTGAPFDTIAWVKLCLWVTGAQAAYGCVWRLAFTWIEPVTGASSFGAPPSSSPVTGASSFGVPPSSSPVAEAASFGAPPPSSSVAEAASFGAPPSSSSVAEAASFGTSPNNHNSRPESREFSNAWWCQWFLFHGAALTLTITTASLVVLSPGEEHAAKSLLANWQGGISVGLSGLFWTLAFASWRRQPKLARQALGGMRAFDGLVAWNLMAISVMAAAADALGPSLGWLARERGFHVLEMGWLAVACLAAFRPSGPTQLAGALSPARLEPTAPPLDWGLRLWGLTLGAINVWLTVVARAERIDTAWWSLGFVAGAQACAVVLAVRERRRLFAFLSLPASLAASIYAIPLIWPGFRSSDPLEIPSVVFASILAWGTIWLVVEVYFQARGENGLCVGPVAIRPHRFAAWLLVVVTALWFGFVLSVHAFERTVANLGLRPAWKPPSLYALGYLALLLSHAVGVLWDRRSRTALVLLYLTFLPAYVVVVDALQLDIGHSLLALAWCLTGQMVAASWLWNRGILVARLAQRLGITDPLEGLRRAASWLPALHSLLLAPLAVLALILVLERDDRVARTIAALLPLGGAFSVAFVAQQERARWAPRLALLSTAFAGVLMSWADLPPGIDDGRLLTRAIRALMGLIGLTFVYALVARRLVNWPANWLRALRECAGVLGVWALLVLLGTIGIEAVRFEWGVGVATISNLEVAAVGVTLLGLAAGLIGLALWPEQPDGEAASLSPWWEQVIGARSRRELWGMLSVYGAQLVVLLLFAHLYLSRPFWFDGLLRPWWPYVMVAIAFTGVAVGELLQRWGSRVLAEPLQRTGMLLPLFPALGWWIAGSTSDYALVLLGIGLVYVTTSVLRKSWWSRVAAAIAGNGALWAFLQRWDGFSFVDHPQLWVIPPAASVLAAVHWNRDRLTSTQVAAARYFAVMVIYLSSTSELFIVGIGASLWPPLILLMLSLTGVFVGMAARIRAFLFLGAIFVVLSLVSMVWHASRSIQHVWPWWAFGICSGVLILVLFGLFEKKRAMLEAWIGRLRGWEK